MADFEKLCFGCMREKPDFSPECPYCKYDGTKDNQPNALPIKTLLQKRYYVGKILNENGEGITYIGYDALKECTVRIREFFPVGIVDRINTLVKPFSQYGFTFDKERAEFNALAKSLSHMNGFAGLLNILDIFDENGTTYYITEYVEAITLRDFLLRNGGVLSYEQFRPLFMPLLSTISSLHAVDIIHRGISPDTILVGKDGKLRLTEFTVHDARTARTELQASLHKGYAAIEQYGFDGEQGPWTDVYALGALMYRFLVGNPPPEATVRVTDDKMTIPADVAKTLPGNALSALANALEIMPEDRTKTVEEFRNELTSTPKLSPKYNNRTGEVKAVASKQYRNKIIAISVCATVVVLAILICGMWLLTKGGTEDAVESTTTTTATVETTQKVAFGSDQVPDFVGIKFSDILSSPDYIKVRAKFNFEVSSKQYSSKPKGEILSQTPAAGTEIKEGQVVKLVISLGSEDFSMPNIVGLSKEDAYIKLLEAGFSPENITFGEKYLPNSLPEAVVDVTPGVGETVNCDMKVTVNVNTYIATTATTTATPITTTATPITTVATTKQKTTKQKTTKQKTTVNTTSEPTETVQ
ncbi:MAG: PASTA domain-containing protein [Acutalibacteraceae bacterium]